MGVWFSQYQPKNDNAGGVSLSRELALEAKSKARAAVVDPDSQTEEDAAPKWFHRSHHELRSALLLLPTEVRYNIVLCLTISELHEASQSCRMLAHMVNSEAVWLRLWHSQGDHESHSKIFWKLRHQFGFKVNPRVRSFLATQLGGTEGCLDGEWVDELDDDAELEDEHEADDCQGEWEEDSPWYDQKQGNQEAGGATSDYDSGLSYEEVDGAAWVDEDSWFPTSVIPGSEANARARASTADGSDTDTDRVAKRAKRLFTPAGNL